MARDREIEKLLNASLIGENTGLMPKENYLLNRTPEAMAQSISNLNALNPSQQDRGMMSKLLGGLKTGASKVGQAIDSPLGRGAIIGGLGTAVGGAGFGAGLGLQTAYGAKKAQDASDLYSQALREQGFEPTGNVSAADYANLMRGQYMANRGAGGSGGSGQWLAAFNMLNSPEFEDLSPEQQQRLTDFVASGAKGAETLQGQEYAKKLGAGMGTLPTAYDIELQKMAGSKGFERPVYNVPGQPQVTTVQPQFEPIQTQDGLTAPPSQLPKEQASLTPTLKPLEGSEVEFKRQQEIEKIERDLEGKEQWKKDMQVAGATVVRDADRIFELIKENENPIARIALSTIPGTGANALKARIDSIKANVGLDKLVKIKQSGAGLGQVPQSQLDLLSNTLGAFNISQKNEDLEETIKRIKIIYNATAQGRPLTKEEATSVQLDLPDSFFNDKNTFDELWGE